MEITCGDFHGVCLCAERSIPEINLEDPLRVTLQLGGELIFTHSVENTWEHRAWTKALRELGRSSHFLAFFCKHENLKFDWEAWQNNGLEPIWICSTGNYSANFGEPNRTYLLRDDNNNNCLNSAEFIELIRTTICAGNSRVGIYGNPVVRILLEFFARDFACNIHHRWCSKLSKQVFTTHNSLNLKLWLNSQDNFISF
jgi:hypothetical protein